MVYRRLKTDSASLLPWFPASSGGPRGGRNCLLPPSGRCGRTAKNACLECFLERKIFSCAEEPMPNPWARFGCGGCGTAPASENALAARGWATVGKWACEAVGKPLVRLRVRQVGG